MSAQIPIPSFEDIRKLLHFWFDQKDKWFYFETDVTQTGKSGEIQNQPQNVAKHVPTLSMVEEIFHYSQTRLVGKIDDVIEYPPSLLLKDVTIFNVNFDSRNSHGKVTNEESRNQYGLVFSQITYFEPIDQVEHFKKSDSRIR